MRKILGIMLTVVMCMSFTIVSFAASKVVDGYGTLSGTVAATMNTQCLINTVTSVTANPDNAYMKVQIEIQDYDGYTLWTDDESSERGRTSFLHDFEVVHFDDVKKIYSAHNIQGGRTYAAQVVYTSTTDIPY